MDPPNSALARRSGQPYRGATDTPLEVMLRSGALPQVRRPVPYKALGFAAGLTAVALAIAGVEVTGQLVGVLGVIGLAIVSGRAGGGFSSRSGTMADLRARIDAYPL